MDAVDVGVTKTVEGWLEIGEAYIDERYGDGFAAANPVLLGAYVQACAVTAARTALSDDLVNALRDLERRVGGI